MTPEQVRRAILRALRYGGLNPFEIADETGQAPFRVQAELKALRRDRLVYDDFAPNAVIWTLTGAGYELAFAAEQMTVYDMLAR